jgi:RNA polymerase sigma factor (sigma-70 family)
VANNRTSQGIVQLFRTACEQAEGQTDGHLLGQFVARRDEDAFAVLVRRHGPMVLGVCHRVLGNAADTEDAFQATFLVLVHKAASLTGRAVLGDWLHGVARRVALNARRAAARRRIKEQAMGRPEAQGDEPRNDWLPLLDEELSRLPEKYRLPIVLCELEGKARQEAARLLGWPEGTVASRLARGRTLLARQLARHGLAVPAGTLGVLAQQTASASVPAALVDSTVKAASLVAAGQATATQISANVVGLTQEALKAMFLSKLKTALAVVVLVVLGAVALGYGVVAARQPSARDHAPGQLPWSAQTGRLPVVVPPDGDGPKHPAADPKAEAGRLAGTWLFDAVWKSKANLLPEMWASRLTVSGSSFTLFQSQDGSNSVVGTFVLDPTASPKTIDLNLEEFDLLDAGEVCKVPACTLPGIYKLEDDRLTVCFTAKIGGKRPAMFETLSETVYLFTVARAAADFKEFPKEATVKVTEADGKPAAGATVAGLMDLELVERKNAPPGRDWWTYADPVRTGADGRAKLSYQQLSSRPLIARDPENQRMALATFSPVALARGEGTVALENECRIVGTIVCDHLQKAGKPVGKTSVALLYRDWKVATCFSPEGKFEFVAPPGTYTLRASGSNLEDRQVTVTVLDDWCELALAPLALPPSRLLLLEGQPAPELEGVVGWKGEQVKLADLKGSYVLLEFWGYWCGRCVGSMPMLIELHEKFAGKGLAIVGVHVDLGGEVDTASKLNEKVARSKKELWNGKDLPFPVALTSGKFNGEGEAKTRRGPVEQYGVSIWPTAILIDPEGKVVGKFPLRDVKTATEEIEKLLRAKKE